MLATAMLKRRLGFAQRMLRYHLVHRDARCPFCAGDDSKAIDGKFGLIERRECNDCGLQFRWPKDTPSFNAQHYQSAYDAEDLTTRMPSGEEIAHLRETKFAGTEKDYATRIRLLESLPAGRQLFEFGCSWGYFLYQIKAAGFEVACFSDTDGIEQFSQLGAAGTRLACAGNELVVVARKGALA